MLCCLEEARRYKKCGHMMVNHDSNCERIYVLYMTTNKNGKVNFLRKKCTASTSSPTELPQNIEPPPPFLCTPLKFQKKFPRIKMSCLKSWSPLSFTKGGEETMSLFNPLSASVALI